MSKVIENVMLFVGGDAAQPDPSKATMSYEVVDGKARKKNCIYEFPTVDSSKTANELWADGVAAIKTKEGIEEE